jgi:hypothetical protein
MAEEYETYKLGDFDLKSGGVIPNAYIAFKTFGDPSLPAIIYPSWYSGGECLHTVSQTTSRLAGCRRGQLNVFCFATILSVLVVTNLYSLTNLSQQSRTISGSLVKIKH